MGRKTNAAKASLVAAFLAAGGATASTAKAANPGPINWGDQLIRFLKLDGLPQYLKYDDSAQLATYYKPQLIADTAAMYQKWGDSVAGVLDLYWKDKSSLSGILIGLSQYYKEKTLEPLLDYLKTPGAMTAYIKFQDFLTALKRVSGDDGAFGFFYKETGIAGNPLEQLPTDGGAIG